MKNSSLKTAKKMVAWLPMWTCYLIGDLASKALDLIPDSDLWEWLGSGIYRIYNRCMFWSLNLNDWAGFTLWRDNGRIINGTRE